MSQEKALPLQAAYQAISRLDADMLVSICHPDVRFESRITSVDVGLYEGHDGVRQFIQNLAEAFQSVQVESSDVIAKSDRAVVTNQFRARGRGSGVDVEARFFVAGQGGEGRLSWWGMFDSRAEALEAVGLSDSGS